MLRLLRHFLDELQMQFAFKWAVMTDGEREKGEGREGERERVT